MKIENTERKKISLDEKDLAILKLLQENARYTVKEIASRVNLSTTPVHERIKALEESGVIKQYVTIIDAAKVNLSLTVICYVSLKEHGKNAGSAFIRSILSLPQVIECFSISGEFDFMLKIVCEDMNAFYNFHVNVLSELQNVGHIQSTFVMGIIKDTHQIIY